MPNIIKPALKAVDYYRERYSDKGIYENVLFDGIEDMLAGLKNDGYVVALATCKPEIYVPRILEYFNVDKYFDVAVGSELEGGERRHKNQVIDEVFVRLAAAGLADAGNLSETKSQSIMIGDRKDDILGAKASGIDSMGVRYGFAEEQELEIAGKELIVTPKGEKLVDFGQIVTGVVEVHVKGKKGQKITIRHAEVL